MLNKTLGIATLALAAAAATTRADIMHWFWEVEVNGEAVDATRPVVVEAGDSVDISLWSTWDPHRWGLAESAFAIATGDHFFEVAALVSFDESLGYGRNPAFGHADNFSGQTRDTDGTGEWDTIDLIWMFQLPPLFGHDDQSNPLKAYTLRWELEEDLSESVSLARAPTVDDGWFINRVYGSEFGGYVDYSTLDDTVVFVPAPLSWIVLLAWLPLQKRRGG